jgi:hypothetical protein
VATNTISQGQSRQASLDYILQNGGYIHDAISTQPWSGEAAVHVSIVNWIKSSETENIPCRLDHQVISKITSSLTSELDISIAKRLNINLNRCFKGIQPTGKGFLVTEEQVNNWIQSDPKNKDVLRLFSMGANLAQNPHGKPDRWIIDFNDMSIEDASSYRLPFEHIKTYVKPERDKNRRESTKVNWWQFGEKRPAMRKALAHLPYCFAVPEVSKWAMFIPFDCTWLPGNNTHPVAADDFYILGILTSSLHRAWVKAQSSTLEDRTRYTHNTCFETFPFPPDCSEKKKEAIRQAMQELQDYRTEQMENRQWGITRLYNEFFHEPASRLAKLHRQIDKLVREAYGIKSDRDPLEFLLELNHILAGK